MLSFLQCKVSLEAVFLVLFFSLNNSRVVNYRLDLYISGVFPTFRFYVFALKIDHYWPFCLIKFAVKAGRFCYRLLAHVQN